MRVKVAEVRRTLQCVLVEDVHAELVLHPSPAPDRRRVIGVRFNVRCRDIDDLLHVLAAELNGLLLRE